MHGSFPAAAQECTASVCIARIDAFGWFRSTLSESDPALALCLRRRCICGMQAMTVITLCVNIVWQRRGCCVAQQITLLPTFRGRSTQCRAQRCAIRGG